MSLSVTIILAGLAALYGIYMLVFLSSYFGISDIVVKGHWEHLDAAGLVEVAEVKQGDNLFLMNVKEVHHRLTNEPWVREAAVRRHLPHTLLITVEEYEPVAILVKADGMHYVDEDGVVFKALEPRDSKDYPFITGVAGYVETFRIRDEGEKHFVQQAFNIMDAVNELKLGKKLGIAEIHFDPIRGFSVVTDRRPMEILLGSRNLDDRLARLDRMEGNIRKRGGQIRYILADEAGRVIVRYRDT